MNPNDTPNAAAALPAHVPPGSTPAPVDSPQTGAVHVARNPLDPSKPQVPPDGEKATDTDAALAVQPHPIETRDDGRGVREVSPAEDRAALEGKIEALRSAVGRAYSDLEPHAGAIAADLKGEIIGFERTLRRMLDFHFGRQAPSVSTIRPSANAARS
jgi:hypothetical protein